MSNRRLLLPPISFDGLTACLHWLARTSANHEADPAWLIDGLPQGRILSADVRGDGGIAMRLKDQHEPGRDRTPFILDPEGFCLTRLILTPKAQITIARTELPPRVERHRVTFYDDIGLIRVIAGARRGQVVYQIDEDHRDFRRRNLSLTTAAAVRAEGKEMRREVHQGRALAVQRALDAFDKASLGNLPINRACFAAILKQSFRLNDRLSLGTLKEAG